MPRAQKEIYHRVWSIQGWRLIGPKIYRLSPQGGDQGANNVSSSVKAGELETRNSCHPSSNKDHQAEGLQLTQEGQPFALLRSSSHWMMLIHFREANLFYLVTLMQK
jgi:hypothetical protein